MRLSRHGRSTDRGSFNCDGFRTDRTTAIFKGVICPLPLLVWGIWNLATWTVHWRSRGIDFISHANSVVLGVVCVKWGIAFALVTWHLLANSPRFDEWIHILLAVSCGVAILGLISTVVGALA